MIEVPTSMTKEGNRKMISTSLSESMPHMPRVTLRTVEPAKVLACQSDEKRCTRAKASCATSPIILRVKRMRTTKLSCRITTPPRPSTMRITNAVSAPTSARDSPLLTAVTSWPA